MLKFITKYFKKKSTKTEHKCVYYPVAIKQGLEVHNFCNCGKSYKITDYYH